MEKITENVWKFEADCNVYLLKLKKNILVDTGNNAERTKLLEDLGKVIRPEEINCIILTHMHYDHAGNCESFSNAEIYAGEEEIKAFKDDSHGAVLDTKTEKSLIKKKINPAKDMCGLEVIHTPGHTAGSICLFYEKERILFSGDTLFDRGIGRTDLPTSKEDMMQATLEKIKKIKYKILCPGHDY